MTTETTEILLDVDVKFLEFNDIANYANELDKNKENTASIESIEHNMNGVSIIFAQEKRKFNLCVHVMNPVKKNVIQMMMLRHFLNYSHTMSPSYLIKFVSGESFMALRIKVLNHVKEN